MLLLCVRIGGVVHGVRWSYNFLFSGVLCMIFIGVGVVVGSGGGEGV